ncbi:MAG TPA: LiaF domain-containing protein [Acidimicrobiia bacterium]
MSTSDTLETTAVEAPPSGPRRHYGAIVTGVLLIVAGGLWMLDALDVVELRVAIVLPTILAVVGIALIIGAFDGPHTGLVVAGVFLSLAVIAVAAAPENAFHGGIGERTIRVTDETLLAPRYDVGLGELTLNLSQLTLTESTEVAATVGAGEIRVLLPSDIPVSIEASAGAGQIDLLGQTADGISVSKTYVSDEFETAEVTLTLDLDVAAGNIEVDQ